MSKQYVFDSSAVLSVIKSEKGNEHAEELLENAALSVISISEIISVLFRNGMRFEVARDIVAELAPNTIECSYEDAVLAAKIKAENSNLGLSLGDSVCLALSSRLKCPVVTADRIWEKLDKKAFKVITIR
jgi:ribonuclease VapC